MDKIIIAIISIVTAFVQGIFGGHKSLLKTEVATTAATVASPSGQQNEMTPPPKPKEVIPAAPIPRPTPPIKVSTININMNDLRYPSSLITSEGGGALSLQSSDDAETITNWYKDKLKGLNYNVNSFVTTTANDKILNKLSSANGSMTVSVEISKDSGSGTVKISVFVSSST